MRNTLILFGLATILLTGCNGTDFFARLFQPSITICDLHEHQSVFADSLVYLDKVTVTKSKGLFSISYTELTDGKCSISLLTTKPYAVNETVSIKARYKVLYNSNGQTISALITDDFPLHPNKIFNL